MTLSIRTMETIKRKLVLHFDLQNTIILTDKGRNIGLVEALNTFLTTVTWGTMGSQGNWIDSGMPPSLYPPTEEHISFYKHLEQKLVRDDKNRIKFREITQNFTSTPEGSRHAELLKCRVSEMRWRKQKADVLLTQQDKDEQLYHYIVPSFFRMISYLQEERRDFAIILRTFGQDAAPVLRSIQYALCGHHDIFKDNVADSQIKTDLIPGEITHTESHTKVAMGNDIIMHVKKGEVTEEKGIYDYFSSLTGISGLVDHYKYWSQTGYKPHGGKPLWVDISDSYVQHIMFDDNIRVGQPDNIVDLRVVCEERVCSSEAITSLFADSCLVQNNALKAVHDQQYFITHINRCEENYNHLLASKDLGIKLSQARHEKKSLQN